MTSIFFEDSFDAAHWLPNVAADHKCRRMHGHTYRIRLEVSGPVEPVTGFVGGHDYAGLKRAWEAIKTDLDHRCLNDLLTNPTCENIVLHIASRFQPEPSRIELRETATCGVVWVR